MKSIWIVARRELRALFDHPTGYILLVVFLGVNNFLFFRAAFLIGVASLRPMMDLLPWLFLFFVPAATMRALAEDLKGGTVEVVLAQPLTELEYVLGKFLGQLLFVWVGLGATLAIPVGLSLGADLQLGVVFGQFVGAAFLAAAFTAAGIWTSSMTSNQITAFIVSVSIMFVLVLVGMDGLILGLPPALAGVAARLGVLSHFENIGRGVIDLRDVVYFATVCAAFITLTYYSVMRRKLSPAGDHLRRMRLGTGLSVAILIVVNLFGGQIAGRIDLTPDRAYTLSDATKQLVGNLDDLVTIKLFASRDLPPEIQLHKRDIDDLLSDYRSAGRGMVRVVEMDPGSDEAAAEEVRALGIPPVQFNVVGQGELQVMEGYLGLAIQYADGTEVIPFIRESEDLEYRVSSFVRSLTSSESATVGFVQVSASPGEPSGYQELRRQISQDYSVTDVSLPLDSSFDMSTDVVVFPGDLDSLDAAQSELFHQYMNQGGAALVMARGMTLSLQQQPIAFADEPQINDLLRPFGITIRTDMVFDLGSNERIQYPSQLGRVMLSYPFWLRPLSTKNTVINQELEGLFLPWTSSIDTSEARAGTVTPLFVTTPAAGAEAGTAFLQPTRQFPRDSLRPRLVAVQVNTAESDSGIRGRLVVVGNNYFLTDSYLGNARENAAFALNAIDWLAEDEDLIAIRSKNRRPPQLVFTSEFKRDAVKYGNIAGIPGILVLAGALRLIRRRRRTRRRWGELPDEAEQDLVAASDAEPDMVDEDEGEKQ